MGLSAAYLLHMAGHSLTIYDPAGFPADNASAMAGGMLAPYSEIEHMDDRWVTAGLAGIAFWRDCGLDIGFRQNGSLLVAHEEDRHSLARFISHLPHDNAKMRSIAAIEPRLAGRFSYGLFLEKEAHLNPKKTMRALIEKTDSIFKTESAQIEDVENNFDFIIDCRGMGAPDSDLRGVKGEIAFVRNKEFKLERPLRLMHPRYPLYIVPHDNHVFMIGATVIETDDTQISLRSGLELLSALYSIDSSFGEAEILELKAGVRPSYNDNLPKIKIDTKHTVISCNGLFRHGYLLAPVMAECITEHIAGREHEFWNLMAGAQNDECNNQRRKKEFYGAA